MTALVLLAVALLIVITEGVFVGIVQRQEEKKLSQLAGEKSQNREVLMSWSIAKRGMPAQVKEQIKIDPGAMYVPVAVSLLIDDLLDKSDSGAILSVETSGHINDDGTGEARVSITAAPSETAPVEPAAPPETPSGEAI